MGKDPSKILVKKIIEEWRAQSSRGRYESQVWSAPALAELVGAADGGDGSGGGGGAPMPQVAGPAAGAGEEAGRWRWHHGRHALLLDGGRSCVVVLVASGGPPAAGAQPGCARWWCSVFYHTTL